MSEEVITERPAKIGIPEIHAVPIEDRIRIYIDKVYYDYQIEEAEKLRNSLQDSIMKAAAMAYFKLRKI